MKTLIQQKSEHLKLDFNTVWTRHSLIAVGISFLRDSQGIFVEKLTIAVISAVATQLEATNGTVVDERALRWVAVHLKKFSLGFSSAFHTILFPQNFYYAAIYLFYQN